MLPIWLGTLIVGSTTFLPLRFAAGFFFVAFCTVGTVIAFVAIVVVVVEIGFAAIVDVITTFAWCWALDEEIITYCDDILLR